MALDFYDINDTRRIKRLFQVSGEEFELINEPLMTLKKISGLSIDFYGTTKVDGQYIRSLSIHIQNRIGSLKDYGKEGVEKDILLKVYNLLMTVKTGFLIVGD